MNVEDVSIEVIWADEALEVTAALLEEVDAIGVLVELGRLESEVVVGNDNAVDVAYEDPEVVVDASEELEGIVTALEEVDGEGRAIDVEVEVLEALEDEIGAGVEDELEAAGAGITTVTGGELTSMMEYFVAVVVAVGARGE